MTAALRLVRSLAGLVLLALIRAYQLLVSPLLPPSCRYLPSCSEYARQAVLVHGPLRGTWLTVKRLARCQPWGGCGYDPVPDKAPDELGLGAGCHHLDHHLSGR